MRVNACSLVLVGSKSVIVAKSRGVGVLRVECGGVLSYCKVSGPLWYGIVWGVLG